MTVLHGCSSQVLMTLRNTEYADGSFHSIALGSNLQHAAQQHKGLTVDIVPVDHREKHGEETWRNRGAKINQVPREWTHMTALRHNVLVTQWEVTAEWQFLKSCNVLQLNWELNFHEVLSQLVPRLQVFFGCLWGQLLHVTRIDACHRSYCKILQEVEKGWKGKQWKTLYRWLQVIEIAFGDCFFCFYFGV